MHAAWIICSFSLLLFGFVFSPSLFCFTLNLICVQYLCIFSRYHLEMDVQLSCSEHISQIICFKTEFGESSIL